MKKNLAGAKHFENKDMDSKQKIQSVYMQKPVWNGEYMKWRINFFTVRSCNFNKLKILWKRGVILIELDLL